MTDHVEPALILCPAVLRWVDTPDEAVEVPWVQEDGAEGRFGAERNRGIEIDLEIDELDASGWTSANLTVTNRGAEPAELAVAIRYKIPAVDVRDWLIPGIFYGDNGYDPLNIRVYPRFHPDEFKPKEYVSPYWTFRADRCAAPVVFAQVDQSCYFLSTSPEFSHGMAGFGFAYGDSSAEVRNGAPPDAYLSLHFPWEEMPASYATCHDGHLDGFRTFVRLEPGESLSAKFQVGAIPDPDGQAYAGVMRKLYDAERPRHATNPWMSTADAAELAAYGIFHWFYMPEHQVLVETCSFDKYYSQGRKLPGYVDRYHMHVSWISGIGYAYALARWGDTNGRGEYHKAGCAVIENICRNGIAPCGAFWGQWTHEGAAAGTNGGWDAGWNPDPMWLHARTLAEACYFLADAIQYEEARGRQRQEWRQALASCLDFAVRIQRADGCFGTYYHAVTGEVHEWRGTGALAWIPALLKAANLMPHAAGVYRDAALRAGLFYRENVRERKLFGGCEDVSLSPSTEDSYYGILSYVALYESTGDREHLEHARLSAERLFTFRWMYNTRFGEHTFLRQYDFRTVGGDVASPPNQHLHNYGLLVHAALVRLAKYTGDTHYRDRARDHLHYALQMIARADGDLNARRGMMGEQWYHTDWWQPKGCLLALAHVWCAGFMILVDIDQQELGDLAVEVPR